MRIRQLIPCELYAGEDAQDTELVREMVTLAREYLGAFSWCRAMEECNVSDIAVGGLVGVLLFRIVSADPEVDEWLWVIVGDLPPAYITTDKAPNAACALDGYIGAMQAWVEAVNAGRSVEHLNPVETTGGGALLEPTTETAEMLESRLSFLGREILAHRADDLEAATR